MDGEISTMQRLGRAHESLTGSGEFCMIKSRGFEAGAYALGFGFLVSPL